MEPHDEPEVEEIPEETLGEEDVVDTVDVEDEEEEEVEILAEENHHEEDVVPRGGQPHHRMLQQRKMSPPWDGRSITTPSQEMTLATITPIS